MGSRAQAVRIEVGVCGAAPCPGQGHTQVWHVPVVAGHGVVTPAPPVAHGFLSHHGHVPEPVPPHAPESLPWQPEPSP